MRTARTALGCVLLVGLAASCGGGDGPAIASPSSAFPSGAAAGGVASFLSNAGECQVTIDVAERSELAGGFSCDDLRDPSGLVVDASASFHATE